MGKTNKSSKSKKKTGSSSSNTNYIVKIDAGDAPTTVKVFWAGDEGFPENSNFQRSIEDPFKVMKHVHSRRKDFAKIKVPIFSAEIANQFYMDGERIHPRARSESPCTRNAEEHNSDRESHSSSAEESKRSSRNSVSSKTRSLSRTRKSRSRAREQQRSNRSRSRGGLVKNRETNRRSKERRERSQSRHNRTSRRHRSESRTKKSNSKSRERCNSLGCKGCSKDHRSKERSRKRNNNNNKSRSRSKSNKRQRSNSSSSNRRRIRRRRRKSRSRSQDYKKRRLSYESRRYRASKTRSRSPYNSNNNNNNNKSHKVRKRSITPLRPGEYRPGHPDLALSPRSRVARYIKEPEIDKPSSMMDKQQQQQTINAAVANAAPLKYMPGMEYGYFEGYLPMPMHPSYRPRYPPMMDPHFYPPRMYPRMMMPRMPFNPQMHHRMNFPMRPQMSTRPIKKPSTVTSSECNPLATAEENHGNVTSSAEQNNDDDDAGNQNEIPDSVAEAPT